MSSRWIGLALLFAAVVAVLPGSGSHAADARPSSVAPLSQPTGSWRLLPRSPLAARSGHSAVWTGRELIVFGGVGARGEFADGRRTIRERGGGGGSSRRRSHRARAMSPCGRAKR